MGYAWRTAQIDEHKTEKAIIEAVKSCSQLITEEEVTSHENPKDVVVKKHQDSFTWTFYKFATRKGYVDIC